MPATGLPDTSVFIARETPGLVGEVPEHVAFSVVTIGELQLGALSAASDAARARWAQTLLDDREPPSSSHASVHADGGRAQTLRTFRAG